MLVGNTASVLMQRWSHTTLRKKACHGKQHGDVSTEVTKGEHRRIGITSSSQYPC